jgi:uncharacterized protein YidB (DUF937 family)
LRAKRGNPTVVLLNGKRQLITANYRVLRVKKIFGAGDENRTHVSSLGS